MLDVKTAKNTVSKDFTYYFGVCVKENVSKIFYTYT